MDYQYKITIFASVVMELFRNKYRISTARATWWDYRQNGIYFVTICTQHREHYFGEISKNEIQLTEIGHIAYECWQNIPEHFPFVQLSEFIVMPNHIHGILIIDKSPEKENTDSFDSLSNNKFGSQSRNLPSIIRGYKIGVTKAARNVLPSFAWQTRFHDHIIRTQESYNRIAEYIINNPSVWEQDKFYLHTDF